MSEFISQFHFLRPLWLLAFIPCLLLLSAFWRQQQRTGDWQRVIAPELLQHLLQGRSEKQSRLPVYLLLAGWTLAVLALAGPTWQKIPTPVNKSLQPLVVVVDMSYKMYAEDVKPNRLSRVRYKLLDLFKMRSDGLSALVAYAGSAHTVAPLTDDNNTLANLVPAMSPQIMPEQGDNPLKGIEQAIQLLKQGAGEAGDILLITDQIPDSQVSEIRSLLQKSGNTLSILGIGSDKGAPIGLPGGGFLKDQQGTIIVPKKEPQQLRQLAQSTSGVYADMTLDDSDLKAVLPKTAIDDHSVKVERQFDQWQDAGFWLVLLLLPLALAGFRKGWLTVFLVAAVLPSPPAQAVEWNDLWQNSNQQAMEALNNKKPEQAVEKFTRPDWKAEALYQAGKYEEAATEFAQSNTADGFYNQGNALAKAGKLDQAQAAYDKALKLNPDMKDAIANKKLIEELKKQQQQQQNQQNQQQNQQQNSENRQQNSENQQQNSENQQQNSENQQQNSENQQQNSANQQQNSENQQQNSENQQQNSENQQQNSENRQNSAQQNQEPESSSQSRSGQQQENQEQPSNPDQRHQASEQQNPAENTQQQQAQAEKPEKQGDQEQQTLRSLEQQQTTSPDQQAIENWLKTIPDDPGGLLRRKFLQQQQQREQKRQQEQSW
ncbi:VWA domain-containing protein [Endozoicomonas sp. 4G]|uniref:vWA domain-containing protein n=1 Tax=Endozoicomonas sp. 4G TaxID=2872754 RepID=UPI002078C365|nr:VWA domain-containing protein [Endozoicomonas sp. 4G]